MKNLLVAIAILVSVNVGRAIDYTISTAPIDSGTRATIHVNNLDNYFTYTVYESTNYANWVAVGTIQVTPAYIITTVPVSVPWASFDISTGAIDFVYTSGNAVEFFKIE